MVDRYTKAVLTVIAISLVVLAFRTFDGVKPANAQQYGPSHVIVDSVAAFAYQFTVVPVRVSQ